MASPDSSRDPHDATDGANRKPDLFLIGAPKCGTTSLYEYLKGHPDIYMSPAKEPYYFSPDVAIAVIDHNLRYGRDQQLYLDLFASARGERRVGEASVNYLYSRLAPELIGELQPQPYLLLILRDPVKMIHSLHGQRVAEGWRSSTSPTPWRPRTIADRAGGCHSGRLCSAPCTPTRGCMDATCSAGSRPSAGSGCTWP